MNENSNKIILLGLPESGKTTFLAAFAYYVDAPIDNKSISQYKLSSNSAYINAIIQPWLSGKRQERTKITASQNESTDANLFLEHKQSSVKFTLQIPDFFGEKFSAQFTDRIIEHDFLRQIKESNGITLFIHPERIQEPVLIDDIKQAYSVRDKINALFMDGSQEPAGQEVKTGGNIKAVTNEKEENKTKENNIVEETKEFKVEDCPTQIILCDLLESYMAFNEWPTLNLAIVVSAWDVVHKQLPDHSPTRWIEIMVPLLYQYLLSNNAKINFKVFGVSAQGGDIENPEEIKRLTAFPDPTERIIVQQDDVQNNNITAPIEWLLKQQENITA